MFYARYDVRARLVDYSLKIGKECFKRRKKEKMQNSFKKKNKEKIYIRKEVKLYLKFLYRRDLSGVIITRTTLNNKMRSENDYLIPRLKRCTWYYFHRSRGEKNAVAAIRIISVNRDVFWDFYRGRKSRATLLIHSKE